MSSTYTTNLGLRKPEHRDPETYESWDQPVNDNMDIIDTAFGARSYTEQNYILNSDSHSLSLDKLDIALKDVSDLSPTTDQKAALVGEGTPSGTNKFATKDYVRINRKEVLPPEFVGAVFTIAPGGNNTGDMTSDVEEVSDYRFNYYQWLSAEAVLQSYDISVQWRVPESWLNWAVKALIIDISTQSVDPAGNKVDVIISKDGTTPTSEKLGKVSLVAGTWCAEKLGNEEVLFLNTDGVISSLTGGDLLNITIRVYSKDSNYVRIGAITIAYKG